MPESHSRPIEDRFAWLFDLGWPHLGEVLASHVEQMVAAGRQVLMLITYHFSRGSRHRGRAGFNSETEAAIAHTYAIKQQMEQTFGAGHGTVYPIVCGFESDEDAIIRHGVNGERLRDIEHRGWMICLGHGFDFLHMPNLALIIGPYRPDLADPIRKAAGIIQSNMRAGRILDDGFLLLVSAPYDEIGVDRARAGLKSRFLSGFAADVIRDSLPELAGRMFVRTAVLDWQPRALETLA